MQSGTPLGPSRMAKLELIVISDTALSEWSSFIYLFIFRVEHGEGIFVRNIGSFTLLCLISPIYMFLYIYYFKFSQFTNQNK